MDGKAPEFWDELVSSIPVCIELEKNWRKILQEYLDYAESGNELIPERVLTSGSMMPMANLTITDSDHDTKQSNSFEQSDVQISGGTKKLYEGTWDVMWAGTKPKYDAQWGNLKLLEKILYWRTKKGFEEHLEYAQQKFTTFNRIINEFADEGQCSAAAFGKLTPGTIINPHFGEGELMRCHLSLINDPKCTLTVGDKSRTWEEGKILAFKDGRPYMHSVKHAGEQDRLILMFDFDLTYLRALFPNTEWL
jgi:hypothetical protein